MSDPKIVLPEDDDYATLFRVWKVNKEPARLEWNGYFWLVVRDNSLLYFVQEGPMRSEADSSFRG